RCRLRPFPARRASDLVSVPPGRTGHVPVRFGHLVAGEVGADGDGGDPEVVGNVGDSPLLAVDARLEAATLESNGSPVESIAVRRSEEHTSALQSRFDL